MASPFFLIENCAEILLTRKVISIFADDVGSGCMDNPLWGMEKKVIIWTVMMFEGRKALFMFVTDGHQRRMRWYCSQTIVVRTYLGCRESCFFR